MHINPGVRIEDSLLTVALTSEAVDAINSVLDKHTAELDAALAPHGIKTHDIIAPDYERIVTQEEVSTWLASLTTAVQLGKQTRTSKP